jgi:hypothetical protein
MPWSGSGAMSGAATGASVGGPWGAVIGGIAGGFLGGDEKDGDSRSSGSQTGRLTGQSTESQDLVNSLLEEMNKGTMQSDQVLAKLLETVPQMNEKYSKDAAIADSRDAVTAALSEVLNAGLPGVWTETSVGGGYNSTSTKFLQDNVLAQAASAGARVRQEAITQYAGIQKSNTDSLMQALGLVQDSRTSSKSTGTESGTRSSLNSQDSTLTEEAVSDVGVDY